MARRSGGGAEARQALQDLGFAFGQLAGTYDLVQRQAGVEQLHGVFQGDLAFVAGLVAWALDFGRYPTSVILPGAVVAGLGAGAFLGAAFAWVAR